MITMIMSKLKSLMYTAGSINSPDRMFPRMYVFYMMTFHFKMKQIIQAVFPEICQSSSYLAFLSVSVSVDDSYSFHKRKLLSLEKEDLCNTGYFILQFGI